MKWKTLAASIGLFALGMAGATAWRLSARESAALAAHPPTGQFVDVGGQKVHLVVQGSGPDLVLIHGASGNLRDFTMGLVDRLSGQYRVIALDRPGLGYSDPMQNGDASVAGQARILRAAVAQLGVTRPIVLGQSYGGAVALAWALQEQPAALVLVSAVSMPWPGSLDPWYRLTSTALGRATLVPLASAFVPHAYVGRAVEGVFAPDAPPENYAQQLGVDLTLRRKALAANVSQINNLRPEIVIMQQAYPSLHLPVELVHGDADTVVPLAIHAAKLTPLLPDANLTVLNGAGHMPHHTHPDVVIMAINRAASRAGLR
ncbi:MAG: alpha/beta hydrolase [Rhodobacteraceae bacterium]|nr:alpha/beta hydrolase [Paracoccaceae bacterium]MCF8515307.1 alpha/beta hydrolase [Paracoccaceae bacterium]MCF8519509.1 alpha/beta hydrolase [Paracoccaceae bacterium]